jgi:lipoprotein-anchoring transpeptidase ErfK/SrfK
MSKPLSRRDFLRLAGLSLAGLAFAPGPGIGPDFPRQPEQPQGLLGRVATHQVDVRARPNDEAAIVGNRFRDQIIHIYEELNPPDAPKFYNTLWYRVWGGYIHSAHLQRVEVRLNTPERYVPPSGQLYEVTVPYTTAWQYDKWNQSWAPWRGSRLYYSSLHWVTGIEAGPDGDPWYRVTNELSDSEVYDVPAEHLRPVQPQEWSPVSVNVPPEKKRIEISLSQQTLRAFEYDQEVFKTRISSGIPNSRLSSDDLPTATPQGRFNIYSKMPSKHMGSIAGGSEVEESGGFTLPGVPWTSFFKMPGGYAMHGTYWHNNFGLQMSHGCVNMRNEDSKWIFRWTTPVFDPYKIESTRDWEKTGNGTLVVVTKD